MVDIILTATAASAVTLILCLIYFNYDMQKWIKKVNEDNLSMWNKYKDGLSDSKKRPLPPPNRWKL